MKTLALIAVLPALLLSSCNTVAGFGRDLSWLGHKVESKVRHAE